MYTHSCIKGCGAAYQTEDPEPYYCSACNQERILIAAEIDAKRPKGPIAKSPSELEIFDASPKVKGFVITKL